MRDEEDRSIVANVKRVPREVDWIGAATQGTTAAIEKMTIAELRPLEGPHPDLEGEPGPEDPPEGLPRRPRRPSDHDRQVVRAFEHRCLRPLSYSEAAHERAADNITLRRCVRC